MTTTSSWLYWLYWLVGESHDCGWDPVESPRVLDEVVAIPMHQTVPGVLLVRSAQCYTDGVELLVSISTPSSSCCCCCCCHNLSVRSYKHCQWRPHHTSCWCCCWCWWCGWLQHQRWMSRKSRPVTEPANNHFWYETFSLQSKQSIKLINQSIKYEQNGRKSSSECKTSNERKRQDGRSW